MPEGAGVMLQGFAIDTSGRAPEGICVAGLDLGVLVLDPGTLRVQATLVGGICNDFDTRGPTLRHGKTTRPDGGVEVVLDVAVVSGAPSRTWSAAVWDRTLRGPRLASCEGGRSGYIRPTERVTTDSRARAHLHCGRVSPDGSYTVGSRQDAAPPEEWLDLGHSVTGNPAAGAASLRGFALVLDPVGFEPGASRPNLTHDEALFRNNYLYRTLVRAFSDATGAFVEAGMSHGIHRLGLARDNARPSALYARVDMTAFDGLGGPVTVRDLVASDQRSDPNLLPEDGWPRWARTFPVAPEPACAPGW
jgi:hypothetical protein